MAPRDNQELVPLTDGSGLANNDDELEGGQRAQKRPAAVGGGGTRSDDCGGKGLQAQLTWPADWQRSVLACQQIIGLGTLWRFPYVCFKYGGGTYIAVRDRSPRKPSESRPNAVSVVGVCVCVCVRRNTNRRCGERKKGRDGSRESTL